MLHKNSIKFACWEEDELLEIQLEPEALIIKVFPGKEIRFEGSCFEKDFIWAIRFGNNGKAIQLMPDILGPYKIEIFENGVLLEDWYKYM